MDKRMATTSVEPEDRARKRRKQSAPQSDDKASLVITDGQRLLESIVRRKDRTRLIHKEFRSLPDKEAYPDYYEEITQPIALNEIQAKLFSNGYSSIEHLKRDLNLMFDNAKIYNEKDSQIYKDANTLQKMVQEFEGTEPPKPVVVTNGRASHKRSNPISEGNSKSKMEDLMIKIVDGLLSATDDKTGDVLFEDFRNLVSRKEYPDYYKIIKEPMSLNTVRKRILAHKYQSWPEFEKDLELIVENAATFNEEESFIVQLARELQKRFEVLLLKERGPVDKTVATPAHSGIKLKLNMKTEAQAPSTPAPKLKLTIRNPRGSPEPLQQATLYGNGPATSLPQTNGTSSGRGSVSYPASMARQQSSQPIHQQSPIPTPPIVDAPAEVKIEPNGVPTRPRMSPGGTPKPTKVLPMRKSRTPALLPESESITLVPRGPGSHLSPHAQDSPARQASATPGAGELGNMSAAATPIPVPGSTAMSSPAQPQALNGYLSANGVDPRFRPSGKGIEDALISNLTVVTHPNLNISPPTEYSFLADAAKSFQNHVVFFEAPHHTIQISLALGAALQGRPYTASITVNGHRLFFTTLQPNPNRRREDQMNMACDVRLIPGRVTHIEVLLIAGQKGTKAGMGEQEQEKFVIDAFLHYE